MPPMNKIDKLKRYAVNIFIVCIIALFTIDGMPDFITSHVMLRDNLNPILKKIGLWQGPWDLFAPEPDKENIRITAEVIYADGGVFKWSSPDWRKKSRWYLVRHYRRQEYYDNARRDVNQPAWPALARHVLQLAAEQPVSDDSPAQISLTRHWWIAPDPNEKFFRVANINEPMESTRFYHQAFPRIPDTR
ncbi:MAG: hypothetical protein ACPGVU_17630 [Limisphaerales bacterium]